MLNHIRQKIENGQIAKALAELSLLSAEASRDPEFLTLLAQALKSANQNEALIKVLVSRAELCSRPDYICEALKALYQAGRLNEALDKALQLETFELDAPLRETCADYLLKIYIELNDFEGLQEVLYNYVDVLEFSDCAMWAQGILHLSNDESEKALDCFRKSVMMNGFNDRAWVSLGLLHVERGDIELGLSNFERALDIQPLNETALKMLAKYLKPYSPKLPVVLEKIENYISHFPHDLEMRRSRIQLLGYLNQNQSVHAEHQHLQFMTQILLA